MGPSSTPERHYELRPLHRVAYFVSRSNASRLSFSNQAFFLTGSGEAYFWEPSASTDARLATGCVLRACHQM